MAFKELSTKMSYRKWSLWEKGEFVIGKLTGFKHGEYKGKPTVNFNLEVLEEVDFDDYKGNPISIGDTLSLSRPTALADILEEDGVGSVFRIEYKGKATSASGEQYHSFSVAIDDEYGNDEEL